MKGKILVIVMLLVSVTACADLTEDTLKAKASMNARDYLRAINLLHKNKGRESKKLLSEAYLAYGYQILNDRKLSKKLRYDMAKENYEKAVQADPKNPKAKDFYQMIVKVQAQESGKGQ